MPEHPLDFPPFNTLPADVLAKLQGKLILKTYPQDSYVFEQGQPSLGYLLIIVSGVVGIAVPGEKGIPNVVGLRYAGDFFGETVILTGKTYPVSVKAVEELTCYLLDKETFENLLRTHKEFAGFFNNILTDRLRSLYEEMVREQNCDSYGLGSEPFKNRVSDIMSAPIITCPPDTPVSHIARILAQQKISSVVITSANGKFQGLVTERDLIAKVLALDCNPALVYAADIMHKDVPILPPDAFYYQAVLTMIKRQGKYVLVTEQSVPLGIVTIGDLTRARTTSTLALVGHIETAAGPDELANTASALNSITAAMVNDKAPASEICEVVSELSDLLARRLLILGEESLASKGWNQPPVPYCWLSLGSGGRKEQTLSSDQDNAIIYANPQPGQEEEVKRYFAALAAFVVEGLEKAGFKKCPHNIIATNPEWCQSLTSWKNIGYTWIFSPTPESFRQFTIFLDYRPVYGQESLAQELREYAYRLFRLTPTILHHLAKDDLRTRVPLNIFKHIIVEKGEAHKNELDVKRSASIHIIDCVRIFALREGIHETSTLARLNKLVQLEAFSADDAEYFEAAYQSLMMFRIRGNLEKVSAGQIPDNYLNPDKLSKRQQSVLRESLVAIDRLQNLTGMAFRVD